MREGLEPIGGIYCSVSNEYQRGIYEGGQGV